MLCVWNPPISVDGSNNYQGLRCVVCGAEPAKQRSQSASAAKATKLVCKWSNVGVQQPATIAEHLQEW